MAVASPGGPGRFGRGDDPTPSSEVVGPEDGADGRWIDQPLTPPAVRPLTMRRWKSNTMMISGTVTMAPAAIVCV